MSVGRTKDGILYFSVRYTDERGKVHQKKVQSSKWKTKREAKKEEELFLARFGSYKSISFDELCELFIESKSVHASDSTIVSYRNIIGTKMKSFSGVLVAAINERMVERWQSSLLDSMYANKTIVNTQVLFFSIMRFARNRGYIEKELDCKIAKRKVIEKQKEKTITDGQFKSIIGDGCNDELRAFVIVLYFTGARECEVLPMSYDELMQDVYHIDRILESSSGSIKPYTKNGKPRDVYVPKKVHDAVNQYLGHLNKQGIFRPLGRLFDKTPKQYQRMYSMRCRTLGIEPHNLHSLRHTHVSNLISMGFTPVEISERTGHSVEMIYNVYGHPIGNPQKRMIDVFDEK